MLFEPATTMRCPVEQAASAIIGSIIRSLAAIWGEVMTSPVLVRLACRHARLLTRGYIFRAAFDFESAATSFAYEPHKDGRHYSAFTKRRNDPPRIHTASSPPSSAVVSDARRPTCRFIVRTSWGCTTVPSAWSNWIVLTTRPPSNLPDGLS